MARIIKTGGHLVLMSPNRWFPFEGHGIKIKGRKIQKPIPLLPWLPMKLVSGMMNARNYWPYQLVRLIRNAGLKIIHLGTVFPVFEFYPWLPKTLIEFYWKNLPKIEKTPILKRFGVSTIIIATKESR
jgi:hypothetical protein